MSGEIPEATLANRGLGTNDIGNLLDAKSKIYSLANRDCDCPYNSEGGCLDNPCDVCVARQALDAINRVIDPIPETLHPRRLLNMSEKVYWELWLAENDRKISGRSGGLLIEHLLRPEGVRDDIKPPRVSQRDMTVATSIIQWFGTSCGRNFIENAEREIKHRNALRTAFHTDGWGGGPPTAWLERTQKGEIYEVADQIASQYVSIQERPSMLESLRQSIINVVIKFRDQAEAAVEARVVATFKPQKEK